MLHLSRSSPDKLSLRRAQQFLDGLGAHHGLEAGGTILLVRRGTWLILDDFVIFYRRIPGSTTT